MVRFGSLWIDNVWPATIGLLAAIAHVADGGGAMKLVTGPVIGWCIWQLGRWIARWWRPRSQP